MKLRGGPSFRVDAVGYTCDRNFLDWHTRPDILPELLAHFSVKLAYAIGMPTYPKGEDGHAEGIRRIHSRFAEPEKIVKADAEIVCVSRQIASHHLP
jgi:hypothetical protein